jgi:hypothetical protein
VASSTLTIRIRSPSTVATRPSTTPIPAALDGRTLDWRATITDVALTGATVAIEQPPVLTIR